MRKSSTWDAKTENSKKGDESDDEEFDGALGKICGVGKCPV